MPYVPGFTNDIFVSYAHGDNEGAWVSVFHERLRIRLRELLGIPPVIWRDERRLGGETAFGEEIRVQVSSAALLVAIVSPNYLGSGFCRTERQSFDQAAGPQGGIRVGQKLRIIKVVKTPKEGNQHRLFLKEALGFEFFRATGDEDFDEFKPGDREFDDEVDRMARRLRDLLREMRNQRQAIYLAEPPAELEATWLSVGHELSAQGYAVVPQDRLDPFFADEALLGALRPAILTVHLLGGTFNEFSARQAHLAAALEKQAIVWVAPGVPLDQQRQ